jgi:hypothetical protein
MGVSTITFTRVPSNCMTFRKQRTRLHSLYCVTGCTIYNLILFQRADGAAGTAEGKVLPGTGHEGPEGEQRHSSTLSLTLALDEGGWSTPRSSRFTPRKETRYPVTSKSP